MELTSQVISVQQVISTQEVTARSMMYVSTLICHSTDHERTTLKACYLLGLFSTITMVDAFFSVRTLWKTSQAEWLFNVALIFWQVANPSTLVFYGMWGALFVLYMWWFSIHSSDFCEVTVSVNTCHLRHNSDSLIYRTINTGIPV